MSLYFRPHVKCPNKAVFSVQASEYTYCTPQDNVGPYTHVEVQVRNVFAKAALTWAFRDKHPTVSTLIIDDCGICAYCPVEVIERAVASCGLPNWKFNDPYVIPKEKVK